MDDIFPPAKEPQLKAPCVYLPIFTNAHMAIYYEGMHTLPALLLAAASIGIGHAVMPDHWLPLGVVSRTNRYRTGRVMRLSLAAAVTHVVVSLALGAILVVIGLQFRGTIARHTGLAVGGILLATGVVFLVLDLLGKGHAHSHDGEAHHHSRDHHHHDHAGGGGALGLAGLLIPFGAAASPDLTIRPVFLAASALGITAALGTLASFAIATIATIAGLTTATALGARLFTAAWIDRRANLITALALIAIGAPVAAF
jgi:nickel/cobalt transporter (NicO) family protein